MADPYVAPTDPEERLIEIQLDSWVMYSRYILFFCGALYVLLGVGFGPLMAAPFLLDPDSPQALGIVMLVVTSLLSLVLCGGLGVLNFVAAAGLGRGKKWGWVLTLVIAAIYLPSGCFPFGGLLLYGMLNDRTRKLFSA